jgi:hypothetical protein
VKPVSPTHGPITHVALAALIVVASLHCAWEWQAEFKQLTIAVTYRAGGQPLPLLPSHGCDNEYGCICRGATVALTIDVAHCQALPSELLPVDLEINPVGNFVLDLARNLPAIAECDSKPPPISGRQLRALYASLLI